METEKTRTNHEAYDLPDCTDSDQHHAFVAMLALLDRAHEDDNHSAAFIRTASRLEASPAFREYAQERGIKSKTAAEIMIAGVLLGRRAMDRALATWSDVCDACDR